MRLQRQGKARSANATYCEASTVEGCFFIEIRCSGYSQGNHLVIMLAARRLIQLVSSPSMVRRWWPHVAELALILGAYLIYLGTRDRIFQDTAMINAQRVISWERSAGIFWEAAWQSWALENAQALVLAMNWLYIVTYWPIVMGVGLFLFVRFRSRFYYYRTVVVISLIIALGLFMAFPVASPFRITGMFVDSIQTLGPTFYGSPQMAVLYNTNAAMPSLHFCWSVILGVLFFRSLNGWSKLFGPAYPVVTFFAITLTANHFILDAVAGGLLAGLSFAIMAFAAPRWPWLARTTGRKTGGNGPETYKPAR